MGECVPAATLIRAIDNTSLTGAETEAEVAALARRAAGDGAGAACAAVCVYPEFISLARAALPAERGVKIATVINFPAGTDPPVSAAAAAARAIAVGADEIDLVIDWRRFVADDPDAPKAAEALVAAVKKECLKAAPAPPAVSVKTGAVGTLAARGAARAPLLKVIIESGELGTAERISAATRAVIAGGADMVKTSTGKASVHATEPAVREILRTLLLPGVVPEGCVVGVKVAGGVRTTADARKYYALAQERMGADWPKDPRRFRIGASSLLQALRAEE